MKTCLKSCGDWASAKKLPGCSRTGTRKSRAPSGVPSVMVGVQTSMNPCSSIERRIAAITVADRRAVDHLAPSAHDELRADRMRCFGRLRRALGVDDELHDTGVVAQVDEDE